MNLINLRKKLIRYDIIIFDLDDTIYPQKNYDNRAIFHISKFISERKNLNIFSVFSKLKKIKNNKTPQLLFNNFFKNEKIKYQNNIILKCVSIFQNYKCKELRKSKSLKSLIKKLYRSKLLFLVSNGNIKRQKNKIKYLGIKKYFKKIFILDGIKKKIKPSIQDVRFLVKLIKTNKNFNAVYVGDNVSVDKKFAKNLKIDFIFYKFPTIQC